MILATTGVISTGKRPSGDGLTALNYTVTGGAGTFVESPAGTWGDGPSYGVASQNWPSSGEAFYQAEYTGTNNDDVLIGADADSTVETYPSWAIGIGVSTSFAGNYITTVGATVNDEGVAAVAGDKYRLHRKTNGDVVGEYHRSGSWTELINFGNGDIVLYLKAEIVGDPKLLTNPKGGGLA